ncbi:MAG: peroxiredoxin [Thermodesulfobacteriota bacterium]
MSLLALPVNSALAQSGSWQDNVYDPGKLKPVDSRLKVEVGQRAPDFALPSVSGEIVSLSRFKGRKHVVISFVPAAWTTVCSDQWPGYNIAEALFAENNAILLGISVDNIPTLFAWTRQMGELWFPVLSDFWPHGKVADTFGVLRSDGTSERAIFIIDKAGIIRYAHVGDINRRPDLKGIVDALTALNR